MERAVLIYDGACGLCRAAVRQVGQASDPDHLEFLPLQAPERGHWFPDLSDEACMREMVLVLQDGRVLTGGKALPHLLRRMKGWRWLAYAFAVPGVGLAAGGAYCLVARNRYNLSRARGTSRSGLTHPAYSNSSKTGGNISRRPTAKSTTRALVTRLKLTSLFRSK
ncbi:MAG: DUF393 domain-containing protein [Chloroflexi bacterium]|nr:DUF393 domain-containing protein [Chloroflexota bacterium]